mmetsp:Transcript_13702/g.41389  ORF Transcript_13702/g.41389 Transcript_13702/m.41389 type:complete len:208 (-) Transcript_13702:1463-2086(-)
MSGTDVGCLARWVRTNLAVCPIAPIAANTLAAQFHTTLEWGQRTAAALTACSASVSARRWRCTSAATMRTLSRLLLSIHLLAKRSRVRLHRWRASSSLPTRTRARAVEMSNSICWLSRSTPVSTPPPSSPSPSVSRSVIAARASACASAFFMCAFRRSWDRATASWNMACSSAVSRGSADSPRSASIAFRRSRRRRALRTAGGSSPA